MDVRNLRSCSKLFSGLNFSSGHSPSNRSDSDCRIVNQLRPVIPAAGEAGAGLVLESLGQPPSWLSDYLL